MGEIIKELEYFNKRQIGRTLVKIDNCFYEVSTVNLIGEDNALGMMLDGIFKQDNKNFETMIFKSDENNNRVNSSRDMFLKRYDTKKEAKEGHKKILEAFKKGIIILKKERFSAELKEKGLGAW